MFISLDWFRYFLTQDPEFDWTTLSRDSYERLFEQSIEQFGLVTGTNNPDLAAFRDRGGLDAGIAWVEDGEPPDSLTAVQTAGRGGLLVGAGGTIRDSVASPDARLRA